MSDPEPEILSPETEANSAPVSEADREKAKKLVDGYINDYHQKIYWYLVAIYGASEEVVEDAMQDLWLYVYRQLIFKRSDQMYKSFLYEKARYICIGILKKGNRTIIPGSTFWNAMLTEDEITDARGVAENKMISQKNRKDRSSTGVSVSSNHPEPLTELEEAELFQRFWASYPTVNLTAEQKEVAFEFFRYGHTLKEISEKRGIPISTLSDWKNRVTDEFIKVL